MKSTLLSLIGTGRRRLYKASFFFTEGRHGYCEEAIYRATKRQLEAEIRRIMVDFADHDGHCPWSFDDQRVIAKDETRELVVNASVLGSLDEIIIHDLP